MDVAIGIALILFGLFVMTLGGARWALRYGEEHPHSGGGGYRPKTVTGTRIAGALVVAVGVAWLATSV